MRAITGRDYSPAVRLQGGHAGVLSNKPSNIVLVVEDQPLLRFLAADMLGEAGYGTCLAGSADEAMEILEHNPEIRLVFSDINMPGRINGLALAQIIEGRWPPVGVVLTSGTMIADKSALPSHSRFLSKPYRWDDVYSCLEQVAH
ncbi:response regulator [Gluconobacter wancherniae]|uniref:response regulator n=1 Tax=Gluconobacter wancherniae TaxID=1307955 RepID=UPI001B8BA34B|nr:response regulator [Gluconobacter wancherniae]MBS1061659.1 response regulator [Gluconobacter wancherniae]